MNHETNVNFHKLVKGLSTNALRYLINVAKQESFNRNRDRAVPEFENKELPKLYFTANDVLNIKNEEWKIVAYEYGYKRNETYQTHHVDVTPNPYVPTHCIDVEIYKWKELVDANLPIKIFLKSLENEMQIELISQSKIFWFHKVLQNAKKMPFERKFIFNQGSEVPMDTPLA